MFTCFPIYYSSSTAIAFHPCPTALPTPHPLTSPPARFQQHLHCPFYQSLLMEHIKVQQVWLGEQWSMGGKRWELMTHYVLWPCSSGCPDSTCVVRTSLCLRRRLAAAIAHRVETSLGSLATVLCNRQAFLGLGIMVPPGRGLLICFRGTKASI